MSISNNYNNYHKLNTSSKAKLLAKQLINDYEVNETGQIAFWLDVGVKSDSIALAVFIDRQMKDNEISCVDDVVTILNKVLPKNFFEI